MDGDPPAAMRYTEARMSQIAGYLLPGYREKRQFLLLGTLTMPKNPSLPAAFPNLLVNDFDWDFGLCIPFHSHNLAKVIDATVYMIDHPTAKWTNSGILRTSLQELSSKGVTNKEAYEELGRGAWLFVLKTEIEKLKRR